jgi:class 3 adenylate cyclase
MDVGVLFADVRGFTALSEGRPPHEVAALLNEFYEAAIDVVCRHAIVDKLVGDEVMGLYLPRLFGDEVGADMLADISQRVCDVAGGAPDGAVERTFELRGKDEPERAFVLG